MEEIYRRIPHRPPFLFIDKIIEITETGARAALTIRPDFSFFEGHYPGNPIMPGVLLCGKAAVGSIRVYSGSPHKPSPESGGLIQSAAYGDGVEMTRTEGKGNGLNDVALTAASEAALLESPTGKLDSVTYQGGFGPVSVRVVDPYIYRFCQC